jgi:hypothetical protein
MKMNLNLTITDEQRNVLACLLAGKDVKRLATRDDVAGYVLGMLAGLFPRTADQPDVCRHGVRAPHECKACADEPSDAEVRAWVDRVTQGEDDSPCVMGMGAERSPKAQAITEETQRRGMTQAEARKYDELIAAGHPPGYARGWITASRTMFGGRLA